MLFAKLLRFNCIVIDKRLYLQFHLCHKHAFYLVYLLSRMVLQNNAMVHTYMIRDGMKRNRCNFLPATFPSPSLSRQPYFPMSGKKDTENDVIAIKPTRKRKNKKNKKNKDTADDNGGFVAWLKYAVGLSGGIKYVNKYLEDGGRYEGSWHAASRCPHNQGSMLYIDGETYDGRWKFGIRHGWGAATFMDGSTYEGKWKNDEFCGKGKFTSSNGDRYVGSWEQGLRHGKGSYMWTNGNTYDGSWDRGLIHGKGAKTWQDGSWYGGKWKHGMRHGKGRHEYPNGNYYKGNWRKGQKDGTGTKKLVDGTKYRGRWSQNKPHGQGKKYWPQDNCTYEGNWENGKHHGFGVKSYNDGTKYEGEWYYGKPHGISLLWWHTGEVFKIDFAYGKFMRLMGMWTSREKYRAGMMQQKIEDKLAAQMWKKMTLDQLESVAYDNSVGGKSGGEGNDGDVDPDDAADEVVSMTSRGSVLSEAQSERSAKESIASKVSEQSDRLIAMGFSKEAANAAAQESLERREEKRQSHSRGSVGSGGTSLSTEGSRSTSRSSKK